MLQVMKIRIYPNEKQKTLIHKTFGCCRVVYNLLLEAKIKAYECGDNLSAYQLCARLVPMKNAKGGAFLKEVDSTALQQAVLRIGVAYKHFFRRLKKGVTPGFPRFKSKNNPHQSYQTTKCKIKDNALFVPKMGRVRSKFHRGVLIGRVKTVTISCEANQYYASINYEDNKEEVFGKNNGKSIGIDVGVTIFAYTSDNTRINPSKQHTLGEDIKKVIKAQQVLSQKQKGSANRLKAKKKLAKKYLKIRNKRDDFLHKVSNKLSENQTVIVEDLKIKNMSKQAKSSEETKRTNAGAKTRLNRLILQQSWGKFFELLDYKLKRNGGKLIKVDPKYTSQKCSACGHISKESRVSQARFVCVKCQHTLNADYNASINILHAVGTTVKAS